jgi:cytoskeleton protein RodZ
MAHKLLGDQVCEADFSERDRETEVPMGWGNRGPTGFGSLLQQARAYKGVTLRDAERATRIPRRHLAALEHDEFHQLPPLIYARGIVRNYAQYLGLDPVDTLARFEEFHGQRSGGFKVVPAVKTVDVPSHWAPNFAIIAFMVVMSAVIFAWMYSAYFAPPDTNPEEQSTVADTNGPQEVASLDDEEDDDTGFGGLFEGGGERVITPESEDDSSDASGDDDADTEENASLASVDERTFTIATSQAVWVQATVDGELVFEDVVSPGVVLTFEGSEMSVVSGNAPYVNISVDGEDHGALGDVWDAATTYP